MIKKNYMFLEALLITLVFITFISCGETDKTNTKTAENTQNKVELDKTKKVPVDMSQGSCTDCHTTDEKGNLTFETIDEKLQLKENQKKKQKTE